MFIMLHTREGRKRAIDIDSIESITEVDCNTYGGSKIQYTNIRCKSDGEYSVSETFDDVVAKITACFKLQEEQKEESAENHIFNN